MRVKQRETLCTPFLLPPPAAKEKKGSIWGLPKPRQGVKRPGHPLSAHAYGRIGVIAPSSPAMHSIAKGDAAFEADSGQSARRILSTGDLAPSLSAISRMKDVNAFRASAGTAIRHEFK